MFGDVGHARTIAAMLLLPIDTTSSRTCTKPIVSCRYSSSTFGGVNLILLSKFGEKSVFVESHLISSER